MNLTFLVLGCLIALVCGRVDRSSQLSTFHGSTMGTTFTVKVVTGTLSESKRVRVQTLIEKELDEIDGKMSHYLHESDLSRLNKSRDTRPINVSGDTLAVFQHAQELAWLTGGAFDITVGALVNAWGFGPGRRPIEPPSDETLARLVSQSGYTKLEIDLEESTIRKTEPTLTCDLSAIAKGYAVDRVTDALERKGFAHHMIEVGGEIRVTGLNESNQPWRIAIERPVPTSGLIAQRIVWLSDSAMATSGDYRNFYEMGGTRISHTIDPRSGRPVEHRLFSVSVVDELCARADGLATALAVLGPEEGYELAASQGWAALFIVSGDEGGFIEQMTPSFAGMVRRQRGVQ